MDINNIFFETSRHGVRVIGEVIPNCRSVSVGVWVKAGEIFERDNEAGISHFIEHMLFKGTKTRDAKDIALEIDKVGGSINAFTSKENTCYYTRTLDEDIGIAIDLLLDMVCSPRLLEADIENEKNVVCEEILMSEDDPADVAQEAVFDVVYEGYPLSKAILGTEKSVRAITKTDIINYMDRRYTPENIVIACAGNLDKEVVLKLIDEKFKNRKNTQTSDTASISKYDIGKRLKVIKKDIEQAHICLTFPGTKYDDEKGMNLAVIDDIFGGTSSSRLFQSIREERGLAYNVYSAREPYTGTGYWEIYAATAENRAPDVLNCMFSELKKLKKYGLTSEELNRSKNHLKRGLILALESVAAHSSSLGKKMIQTGKINDVEALLKQLENVTMDSVNEMLSAMLNADYMRGVIVSGGKDEAILKKAEELFYGFEF